MLISVKHTHNILYDNLKTISKVLRGDTHEFSDDMIGIICPVYYFGIPSIVKDFITKIKLNSPYVFVLLTYGNMTGNAAGYIDKLAATQGIEINYINSIMMVDNFLPVFDMGKESEKTKESDSDIKKKMTDIYQKVNNKKISKNPLIIMSAPIFRSVMKEGGMEKKFCISKECTACGVCQQVCPKKNVTVDDKPRFGTKCCSCLGCVNLCPQKAITIKREKNPNARFKNPNVSLNEIIDANN